MLSKNDVYGFVEKVQAKALKAVKEKHDKLIDQAIADYLNETENKPLKRALDEMDVYSQKAAMAQAIMKKITGNCNSYISELDMKASLFKSWRSSPSDLVNKARSERDFELSNLEKEYSKVMRICKAKKTGEQAKTALIALGFDVAYLDKLSTLPVVVNASEVVVDKALLFPCGSAGVEGTA